MSIINNAFTDYADMITLKEKDITEMSESFGRRTVTNGRIEFSIRRTKKLKFLVHPHTRKISSVDRHCRGETRSKKTIKGAIRSKS